MIEIDAEQLGIGEHDAGIDEDGRVAARDPIMFMPNSPRPPSGTSSSIACSREHTVADAVPGVEFTGDGSRRGRLDRLLGAPDGEAGCRTWPVR